MFAHSFRSSKTFVTFIVSVAIFTDMILFSLIAPILPFALLDRVGLSPQDVQKWNSILLASYGGALMLGCLFFGWVGDRIPGRKTPFILGLAVLGAATLSFALGRTLPVLLIARMLQGLSSAIVFTVGYTLLFDVVGMQRIGQAMGYTSIGLSLGLLLGPVIGGVLYEYGGYFHVFLPAFALIIVEIVLRFMIIDEKRIPYRPVLQGSPKSSRPRTGANGQTYGADGTASTRTGGDTSRIDAPPEVPSNSLSHSNQDPETEALLPAADPKIVSSSFSILLCSPRFLVAILGQFLLTGITAGFDGVLPVYIRDVFDLNSIHAAFFFSVLSVPMLLSPISGALTDRYGAKWPATGGFILMIPSLILLRLVVHDTALPIPKLAILLFFIGLAYALAMPPLMTEVSSVVEEIERQSPGIFGPHGAYSQAYGLMNTASSGGSMVGPLYAGFVRERMGWRTMSLSMGISSLIMVMFIVVVTKGHDVHAGSSISPSIESTGNGDD